MPYFPPTPTGALGTLNVNTTGVGNVGSGEDDLITYTVVGGTLGSNNDYLSFNAAGTFAASLNNKRVRTKFGSSTIFDSGALAITAATDWTAIGSIIRTSSTTFTASVEFSTSSATLSAYADYSTGSETLSSSLILKFTGEATANNDVRQEFMVTRINSSTTLTLGSWSQTEVDFGATPVSNATFTITNANVSASNKIIAQVAWEAPTSKDLDEIEMDNLQIRCKPANGYFDMYIETADGSYLADKFKINYLIG